MDSSARRGRGQLEREVKQVTDDYVSGKLVLKDGALLTPHHISKVITASGTTKASTGAVSNILNQWREDGFADVTEDKPVHFVDYTEKGRSEGLTALKTAGQESRKAARQASKAAQTASVAVAEQGITPDTVAYGETVEANPVTAQPVSDESTVDVSVTEPDLGVGIDEVPEDQPAYIPPKMEDVLDAPAFDPNAAAAAVTEQAGEYPWPNAPANEGNGQVTDSASVPFDQFAGSLDDEGDELPPARPAW